ncbi:DUF2894 domain-containing protein [Marinobacter fuscus]|uniref:DUF2894 domain-containing protein n=1 Tax=Marinobacter fuscus TaxID=2109942 RepID=A0A2T1KAD9_9GAMM|nr:DUF2894 domain-containing protein [Marinobacter fuscus]PSF07085.1 DUF2894 domain-containing protein [Marinobacter fuscus]
MTVDSLPVSVLDELRQSDAPATDPVRFCYLESLEQRLVACGLQHSSHWQKLEQAVRQFPRGSGIQPLEQATTDAPRSNDSGLNSLSALVGELNTPSQPSTPMYRTALEQRIFGEQNAPENGNSPVEMETVPKSLRTLTRVQADQGNLMLRERVRHAIENSPRGAGPMNAQRLVSRALSEMQRLSPEYLERFARYTDSLLALEQLAKKNQDR